MKTALITGITGQDGSYLAEFLLEKGYDVHGTIRRSSVDFRERIAHLEGRPHFHLHYADMGDSMSIIKVVAKVRPDEIYNLAAQSHVQVSFDAPEFTADVDAIELSDVPLKVIPEVEAVEPLDSTVRLVPSIDPIEDITIAGIIKPILEQGDLAELESISLKLNTSINADKLKDLTADKAISISRPSRKPGVYHAHCPSTR